MTPFVSCYEATCNRTCKATRRSRKARRCSEREIDSPVMRCERRSFRHSSRGTTETCCRFKCPKATHGRVALLDSSMVLLQPILQILIRPRMDMATHRLAYGTRIGPMAIRRHLIGDMTNHSNCLFEKLLDSIPISLLTSSRIDQIPILVDRPIEITPFPVHFQVGFIHIPRGPSFFSALRT